MAHITYSRPDSGLGFQEKSLKSFKDFFFAFSIGSVQAVRTCCYSKKVSREIPSGSVLALPQLFRARHRFALPEISRVNFMGGGVNFTCEIEGGANL